MLALQELRAPFVAPKPSFPQGEILLPLGSLIEISGPDARWRAARLLAQYRQLPAAWIEQEKAPLPSSILHSGLNLKKVLFVSGEEDSAWAASILLRTKLFPIVVFHAAYGDEKELRRFRRQAKDAEALMILIRETTPSPGWPIQMRLRAEGGTMKNLGRKAR